MSQFDLEVLGQGAIPLAGSSPGVFLLFRDEALVYVGQSWNCFLAVAEQTRKESSKSFDKWAFVVEPDEQTRRASIKALILQHCPEYNKR